MKIERLFGIVCTLLNGKATVGELAERFGVSKRTVLRDIDTLSVAGVPIYTSAGKNGGVSLIDDYVLDRLCVSDEGRDMILLGINALTATGIDQYGMADKLGDFFKSKRNFVEVDYSRWGAPYDRQKFEALQRGIIMQNAVAFMYCDSDGKQTRREVYPLKLVYKAHSWYLQAYCLTRADYRTFKLTRMNDVTVSSDATFVAKDYAPPPIDSEWSSDERMERTEITIVFDKIVQSRVYDEFHSSWITKNADGTLTVKAEMPCDDCLVGVILSFADSVVSLEPPKLRELLNKKISAMQKVYQA